MKRIFLTLVMLGAGLMAYAGGYKVSLQGVRQAAMGGVGSTSYRDASVAFYNPAGLAMIDSKLSIAVGAFGISNKVKWQDESTLSRAETDSPLSTPLYFAASYKPTENFAVGVSVTTPFGSTVKWPEDWPNRANVTELTLRAFLIQPTVAYRFTDWFSVGAGFIYARGSVNLQRTLTVGGNDIGLEIDNTDASGTAFNIGTIIKPLPDVTIALTYRSKVNMEAENGDAEWFNVPVALSGTAPFNTNRFNATLPLTSEFVGGISYDISSKFTISGEFALSNWSEYRNLNIELYNNESPGDIYLSSSTKNWKAGKTYRIGSEYRPNDNLAVRLGYYYDTSPVPSEYWSSETPSVDQHAVTGGLGYKFGNFIIDAMAQYNMGQERSFHNIADNFKGDVLTRAFIFGVGVSYNLR